jgi:hypothetical protein
MVKTDYKVPVGKFYEKNMKKKKIFTAETRKDPPDPDPVVRGTGGTHQLVRGTVPHQNVTDPNTAKMIFTVVV